MKSKSHAIVEMNRRGVSASFHIRSEPETYTSYSIQAGRRTVRVQRGGETIIDENDIGDPLNPTNAERSVIAMAGDLDGFDRHLYDIGCGLAVLFNNDASEDHARNWLNRQIQEALKGED